MKTYHEQRYQVSIKVRVTIATLIFGGVETEVFEDEIKGLNRGHALYLAQKNWPDATCIQEVGQ